MDLDRLLHSVVQHSASDLHLQVGSPPVARVHGVLSPLQMDPLTAADLQATVEAVTPESMRQRLERESAADFAHRFADVARFRVNVFRERGHLAVVFRLIPLAIPSLEQLSLPSVVQEIAQAERGLVLVTGTTGSGKSTTLAAMVDLINHTQRKRVITVEDPIEYLHCSDRSLIAQRELGIDADGFLSALRVALRQDPDVILVGELRDLETMRTAIQAADTGHLVFSTVHASGAAQTVQRLIAQFPAEERELLLMQLSTNLEAVISQRLARTVDGKGRLPVVELLRDTPVVRKLIAENRPEALPQAMANRDSGMQLFDQHLSEMYLANLIKGREALRLATNPEAVSLAMKRISTADTAGGLVR